MITLARTLVVKSSIRDLPDSWIDYDVPSDPPREVVTEVLVDRVPFAEELEAFDGATDKMIVYDFVRLGGIRTYLFVFLCGEYVLWMTDTPEHRSYIHAPFPPEYFNLAFPISTYEEAVGIIDRTRIPVISGIPLHWLLTDLSLPAYAEILYQISTFGDADVAAMVRCVNRWFADEVFNPHGMHPIEYPDDGFPSKVVEDVCEEREVRLGVDLPDVPETIFRFGKCDEGWAVRFVENPWFPAPVFSLSLSDSLDEWLKC